MQLVLRAAGIIAIIVSVIWWIVEPSFDPLYAFLTGFVALLGSFIIPQQETKGETLDQRNRRVMLDHVENFWVKGILEKSLHGASLLELGIKEDPNAVSYPWAIKKEPTNETLPAGKSMLEIFREIGIGRSLLILGAPGSGKTTMLLELARQLIILARDDETDPIPVVFNLASWTEQHTLADWLAEQLHLVYYVPRKIAPTWVHENRMLLLLDGLDEIEQDSRARCVDAINQFRKEHGLISLVLCSRTEEYSSLKAKLSLDGAIKLQPLTPKQINEYIDHFGNSLANLRLMLGRDVAFQQLAETPLMLSIMTLAYKDLNANELLATNSIEDQRKYLFNTYVERMFVRLNRSANPTFSETETLSHLSWLARTMIQQNIITYQIESMQPYWLKEPSPRLLYELLVGRVAGLIVGLGITLLGAPPFVLFGNMIFGLLGALVVGLVGGLITKMLWSDMIKNKQADRIFMVDRLKWSWKKALRGLLISLIVWLLGGLIIWLTDNMRIAFGIAVSGSLIVGLTFGLTPEQIEETTYPGQRLKQTLSNALVSTLIVGLIFGVLSGMVLGMLLSSVSILSNLRIFKNNQWMDKLVRGLIFEWNGAYLPLIQHYSMRWALAQHSMLPRRLIPFLEYCVSLIFLRRVGGSYIFVHRLLMEHFAEMDV